MKQKYHYQKLIHTQWMAGHYKLSMANINISQIRMKRGNTAAASTYVGPLGELLVDTGLQTIRIQDGVTAGGMSTLATTQQVSNVIVAVEGIQGNITSNITALLANIHGANISGITSNVKVLQNQLSANGIATIGGLLVGNIGFTSNSYIWSAEDSQIQFSANGYNDQSGIFLNNQNVAVMYANTEVQLASISGNQTWVFDQFGNLTLPGNVVFADGSVQDTAYQGPTGQTSFATTGYVDTANSYVRTYTTNAISTAINNLINSAPGTLDTLGEIAANLASEGSAITAITNSITNTNANVNASNAAIVTANTAMKSYVDNSIFNVQYSINYVNNNVIPATINQVNTAMLANVAAANSAIVTANTAMKGYVDSVNTAWAANAAIQQTLIDTINANITSANLAIASLQSNAASQESEISGLRANIIAANILIAAASGTYSNANVASYLVANPQPGTYSNTNVSAYIAGNLSTINSNVTAANLAISTLQANVGSFYTWANTNFGTSSYANSNVAGYLAGNITVGNLITTTANATTFKGTNFVYANGVSILTGIGGTYSNANVTAYLSAGTDATILGLVANTTVANLVIAGHTTSINNINANIGAFEIFSNANTAGLYNSITGANTAIQNLNANIGAYETWANANFSTSTYGNANVAAYLVSNPQAGTYSNANVARYLPTDPTITTLQANVGTLYLGNASTQSNLGAFQTYANTAIASLSTNANANTAAYLSAGISANVKTSANIIAPNYLFANGVNILSTVSGGSGTYSNTNVASYLTTATITTTGNITAGNLIGTQYGNTVGTTAIYSGNVAANYFTGNGSALTGLTYNQVGNIYGTSSNVTLVAGSYSWTFDNTGNLTIPTTGGIYYANGTQFTSGSGSGGTTYTNANVVSMLAANSIVVLGNINSYPTQANITQLFVGGNTVITSGAGASAGQTQILNNAYFGSNGAMYTRNTYTNGAGQFYIDGANFYWNAQGSATANTVAGMGSRMSLTSTALSTINSIGITSAGTLTVQGTGGIVTTQSSFPLINTTATTINFGGAATLLTIGASTGNVAVGSGAGTLTAGYINTNNLYTANAVIAGGYISNTANVTLTSGGNILGVGNIIGVTANTTITANTSVTSFLSNGVVVNNTGTFIAAVVTTIPIVFGSLPAASAVGAGARAFITDGNTATFGSQVSGGGANKVPVYSDGTNWFVG
jgi:hypothetical protein